MRFVLENFSGGNVVMMMRKAGYFLIGDYREDAELSFIRTISIDDYPRFHIYLRVERVNKVLTKSGSYLRIYQKSKQIVFNLHIDQKKSVFKNYPDHGAEYKGEVIEREAERITGILE